MHISFWKYCFTLLIPHLVVNGRTILKNPSSKLDSNGKVKINVPHDNFEIVFTIEDQDLKKVIPRRKGESINSYSNAEDEITLRPPYNKNDPKLYNHDYSNPSHVGPYHSELHTGMMNWWFNWFMSFFQFVNTDPRRASPPYRNPYMMRNPKPKMKKCNCPRRKSKTEYFGMAMRGLRRLKTVYKNVKKKLPFS